VVRLRRVHALRVVRDRLPPGGGKSRAGFERRPALDNESRPTARESRPGVAPWYCSHCGAPTRPDPVTVFDARFTTGRRGGVRRPLVRDRDVALRLAAMTGKTTPRVQNRAPAQGGAMTRTLRGTPLTMRESSRAAPERTLASGRWETT
jgi:hypothetical protein